MKTSGPYIFRRVSWFHVWYNLNLMYSTKKTTYFSLFKSVTLYHLRRIMKRQCRSFWKMWEIARLRSQQWWKKKLHLPLFDRRWRRKRHQRRLNASLLSHPGRRNRSPPQLERQNHPPPHLIMSIQKCCIRISKAKLKARNTTIREAKEGRRLWLNWKHDTETFFKSNESRLKIGLSVLEMYIDSSVLLFDIIFLYHWICTDGYD